MENTVNRIIAKEQLQRLSLYLEYVKRKDVDFFNKLIEGKDINFNEMTHKDDMVSPIFMKEALLYNLYNSIINLTAKLDKNDITVTQNIQEQEKESDNYYLSICNNDEEETMLLELIVPSNLEMNPLSIFLYDNKNNINIIFDFLKFYNINLSELKRDTEEHMVLSRKYPNENPLVVIKKI